MSDKTTGSPDLAAILATYSATDCDPVLLQGQLREVFANTEPAAPAEVSATVSAITRYLKIMRQDPPGSIAAFVNAITQVIVEFEKLVDVAPSAVDIDIPKELLARAPATIRRDKRFPSLLSKVEKALGRSLSKMSIEAVVNSVDPDSVPRMLKSDKSQDVIEALILRHGDLIDVKTATLVFKRLNGAGLSPELARAFANLKHRVIGALLPLDDRGALGQTLSRSLLAAVIKPTPNATVTNILRNSGSRRVIECCLDERILAADANKDSIRTWMRAFFEGLARFANSDSEAMCLRLVRSTVSSDAIINALQSSPGKTSWRDRGRKMVVNAALRILTIPELRKRSLSLLVRADDFGWLNEEATRSYGHALAIPQATIPDADDDSALRWRICDRVIACIEKARDQNYARAALEAILLSTLGEFGLRTGANAGDYSSFDIDIHQITLWNCRQGEPILLQTDLLRLDDPVSGDVVRKAGVIPVAKVNAMAVANHPH